jgi:sulfatase modifying factor 1
LLRLVIPPWLLTVGLGCAAERGASEATQAGSGTAATSGSEASSADTTEGVTGTTAGATGTTADTSTSTSEASGTTGTDPEPADDECSVSGVPGTCGDVTACTGLSLLPSCDGPPATQCCLPDAHACSVDGAPGLCMPSTECPDDLTLTPGLCPGDARVQCCTDPALACSPLAMPLPNAGLTEAVWDPACPAGMIAVEAICIDRFEASLVELDDAGTVVASWSPYFHPGATRVRAVSLAGAVPQGYIDADTAAAACAEAGKRLCTNDEWLRACGGPAGTTYPWGRDAQPGACNDARALHPAIEYFGTADPWIWSELGNPCILQVPAGLQTTGAHPACTTAEGALDMVGNLHEWTSDPSGTFRGGFFVDTVINGPGCSYATTAHDRTHWDYSTGFRCCADP